MRRKKGQSILEYVIVLTALMLAISYAAVYVLRPAIITDAFGNMRSAINSATSKIPR